MQRAGDAEVFRAVPLRTGGRQDDQVGGGAVGDDGDVTELVFGLGELLEELAAGAHLARAFTVTEVGDLGAVVRGGDGKEGIAALRSAELLQVVAADQTAHAKADDDQPLIRAEAGVDLALELRGHDGDAVAAVGGLERGREAFDPALLEVLAEEAEAAPLGLEDAVDQHDALRRDLAGLRAVGQRSHGEGGEEDALQHATMKPRRGHLRKIQFFESIIEQSIDPLHLGDLPFHRADLFGGDVDFELGGTEGDVGELVAGGFGVASEVFQLAGHAGDPFAEGLRLDLGPGEQGELVAERPEGGERLIGAAGEFGAEFGREVGIGGIGGIGGGFLESEQLADGFEHAGFEVFAGEGDLETERADQLVMVAAFLEELEGGGVVVFVHRGLGLAGF